MKNPRMIILVVILSGLIAVALFTVLLMQRPGDETAADGSDLTVPLDGQAVTDPAQTITDQRFIDGATVTLAYPLNLQFVTDSERFFVGAPDPGAGGDSIAPEGGVVQPAETEPPAGEDIAAQPTVEGQPADAGAVALPTETPQTGDAQGGVPATVNTGNEMFIFIDYTVAAGETMYSISTRRDTSMALMAMYGIDANDMVVGRQIRLPIVNTNYCAGFRDYHLVVEGDNVFRIAQTTGTTNEAIQQANALGADFRIRTNTVLCIP
jgi:LysM repeat protein